MLLVGAALAFATKALAVVAETSRASS